MRYATLTMACLLGLGLAAGCEEELASERSVDVQDDRIVTEERSVQETPGGDIEVTEERQVEPITPAD